MKNGKYTGKELSISWIEYAWFKDDLIHREDGPAVERVDGSKAWWINGKRHRLDGPAREFADGDKWWYYYGEKIECQTQEEFERIIKLLSFR